MKLALKISSWTAIVIGVLALFDAFSYDNPDAVYSFWGGLLFTLEGVLALVYVHQTERAVKQSEFKTQFEQWQKEMK